MAHTEREKKMKKQTATLHAHLSQTEQTEHRNKKTRAM
jgi:hypothetical protein